MIIVKSILLPQQIQIIYRGLTNVLYSFGIQREIIYNYTISLSTYISHDNFYQHIC